MPQPAGSGTTLPRPLREMAPTGAGGQDLPDGREPEVVRGARDQAFRTGTLENAGHPGGTEGGAEGRRRPELERFFSRGKRVCGAGLLRLRLEESTLAAVALSVLAANVFGIRWDVFFVFWLEDDPEALPGTQKPPAELVELHPPIA